MSDEAIDIAGLPVGASVQVGAFAWQRVAHGKFVTMVPAGRMEVRWTTSLFRRQRGELWLVHDLMGMQIGAQTGDAAPELAMKRAEELLRQRAQDLMGALSIPSDRRAQLEEAVGPDAQGRSFSVLLGHTASLVQQYGDELLAAELGERAESIRQVELTAPVAS